jgi:type II secretory pathway pseudopilin PulG
MNRATQRAFSLVEVTLALGVMAFCLVAVLGLLPVGLANNRNSIQQTAATSILSSVAADLYATSGTVTQSSQYRVRLSGSTTLYFDNTGTTQKNAALYQLSTIAIPQYSGSQSIYCNLKVTWPVAQNPTQPPSGTVEIFIALNRH